MAIKIFYDLYPKSIDLLIEAYEALNAKLKTEKALLTKLSSNYDTTNIDKRIEIVYTEISILTMRKAIIDVYNDIIFVYSRDPIRLERELEIFNRTHAGYAKADLEGLKL